MKEFNLEEYLKNPDREVVTRDGKKVRIICTDFDNPDYPVIGEIKGNKWPCSFTTNGLMIKDGVEHLSDLFFAPEKNEGWINIFRIYDRNIVGQTRIFESEKTAIEEGKNYDNYFTTIKIEWED